MNQNTLPPHGICAYIVCKTEEGPRYLILRRSGNDSPGIWQVITGTIENHETTPQAVLREIHEETGLKPLQLYHAQIVETFYQQHENHIAFAPVFIAFVDQMQVTLSPEEHDDYQWLPFEEARQYLGWTAQQQSIALVHQRFILQEPNPEYRITLTSQLLQRITSDQPSTINLPKEIIIRPMNREDIERIADLYLPWSTRQQTHSKWENYYHEQQHSIRTVAMIEKNGELLGYGSLLRQSEYPYFSSIPEIHDVWIYEQHRRKGFGKQLILWLEELARSEGYDHIGLGVGLYEDYGAAQQLYFHLGYQPDGHGITYKNTPVIPGESYPVDDDLILWMTKPLKILSD